MLDLVPTNLGQLLLYLGELLHIFAVVLKNQLGSLRVIAEVEVPSTFSHELEWLTCKSLLAQRLVFYRFLPFAIDLYINVFAAFFFAQADFDVDIGFFAVFDAEVRLPHFVFFVKRFVSTVRLLGFSIARVFLAKEI